MTSASWTGWPGGTCLRWPCWCHCCGGPRGRRRRAHGRGEAPMNSPTVAPVLVVVLALAGVGVLAGSRRGPRRAYRIARHTQEVTRMSGNLTRALGTAVVIVAIQWAVVSLTTDPRAWGVALGVPAVFAGAAIARMFSVTEILHTTDHRRDRR